MIGVKALVTFEYSSFRKRSLDKKSVELTACCDKEHVTGQLSRVIADFKVYSFSHAFYGTIRFIQVE